jgi:hypothetical protein
MKMPGFTAQNSLHKATQQWIGVAHPITTDGHSVIPQIWRYMYVCERSGECYWAWVRV